MPTPRSATTYAAHDQHSSESLAVGLDPYDNADKSKIFSVRYMEHGFVPIFVVITNDGDQPVSLREMSAQLITADRSKISQATEDDIYRRLSKPQASTNRYPLPIPGGRVKGGVNKQAQEELGRARFGAKAVEPHSSQCGFLFFDVAGISDPLNGGRVYLTGVRDAKGNELMYFEVPLDKKSGTSAGDTTN